MNIKQLRMQSFRGINDLTLDFDPQLNILIGNNGSGKSSILDCLSAVLSHICDLVNALYVNQNNITDFTSLRQKNIFLDDDISAGNEKSTVQLEAILNFLNFQFFIQKNRGNQSKVSAQILENNLSDRLQSFVRSTNIPVLIYYSVKRDILFEEYLDYELEKSDTVLDAYNRAFTGGQVVFKEFFEWFKLLEELENELIRDNPNYRDKQLESVRQAIYTFLPEFKDLRIRRRPELRMTVTKNGAELTINQLSDGEKNLLAMVGDLARRLAIANPAMEKPEQGSGVVLIDEIELHLHPKWQRMVIPALLRTFPNCQFIITTHSPQVLGEVKDGKIYRLANTESGVTAEIVRTYGRDSNRILEDEMGVPKRNQKVKDDLLNLFRLIDDGNLTQAKELQAYLKEEIGFDEPEFARADVLIHRKEVLGR
jgi:predicted ATP-binding protein involved in virulence